MEIHPTSEAVIKTVARKLRYYMDVRRRELDFDLSGPQKPCPLWKEPAVQDSVARFFHSQHDRHVKHYFREPRVKKHLQHMEYDGSNAPSRESSVRLEMENEMDRLDRVSDPMLTKRGSLEAFSGVCVRQSRRSSSSLDSIERPRTSTPRTNRAKQRAHSMSRLMHQRKQSCKNHLTTGEAERLLTTASRLIVATETVVLNESGKGWTNIRRGRKRTDEEPHLPLVEVRSAWTNEATTGKSDEIHLDHLSDTQKEHVERKGHHESANGNTSEPRYGRIPMPPPSRLGRRRSNLQSLSDSALFQRRASTFSDQTRNTFNRHAVSGGVMSEDQHQTDDELSEKGTGVKTAVGLVNGKQSPASETKLKENDLVDVQFDKYSDKEVSDEEQQTEENDIQVIDLQEQNEKTEISRNKEESTNDEAKSTVDREQKVGKKDDDQVGGEGNMEHVDQDKEDKVAVCENKKQQEEGKMTKDNSEDNSLPVEHHANNAESENMLELHSLMVDVATQTQNDKSTQTLDERGKGEPIEPESVTPEQLIQEAGRVLRLLQVLPSQVQYEVEVHTGSDSSAGTTASVQLVMFGDAGNSGIQHLQHSSTHQTKFQPGSVDVFMISCAALGKLKGLKVWHDNTGASPSWLLEKVVVREGKEGIADFVFDCNRWLTANENENSNSAQDMGTFAVLYCTGIILKGIASPELENALLTSSTRYYPEPVAYPHTAYPPFHPLSTYSGAYPPDHSVSGSFLGPPANLTGGSARTQNWSRQQPVVVQQTLDEKERQTGGEGDLPIRKSSQDETPHHEETVEADQEAVTNDKDTTDEDQAAPLLSQAENEQQDVTKLSTPPSQVELQHVFPSPQHIDIDQIDEAIREEALKRHLSAIKLQQFFKGFVAGSKAKKSPTKSVEEVLQESSDTERKTRMEEIQRGPNIHQAAQDGNLARLELLLDHNATLLRSTNEHGWSALHKAAAHGHVDCIKLLIARGALLDDFTPTGYCPIHLAAMNGHVHCLQVLKGLGSNVSQQAVDQQTPLHLAASRGLIEACRWLIANRANLKAVDGNGRTPEDIAEEYGHKDCEKLIKECIKEINKKDSGLAMLINPSRDESSPSPDKLQGQQKPFADSSQESTEGRLDNQQDDEEWLSDDNFYGSQNSTEVMSPSETLEEKKVLYEKQQQLMKQRDSSFLDSIRQEIEEDLTKEMAASNGFYQAAVTEDDTSSDNPKQQLEAQDELPSSPAEVQKVSNSTEDLRGTF